MTHIGLTMHPSADWHHIRTLRLRCDPPNYGNAGRVPSTSITAPSPASGSSRFTTYALVASCVHQSSKMSTPESESSDDYILQLPPETLLHIASYIDKPHDLIALAHTNSTLRSYAVAKLYSRICL